MSQQPPALEEATLREKLKSNSADWESRRQLAHLLYDKQDFEASADVIWEADEIPSNDIDLAYAARILAKARPRKAIRLLTAVLEQNHGKAVQNMGMANALLHHGMVLQAVRFYGAALEADPSFANPDLEHFTLWTDDELTLWGDFKNRRPMLGDLPWMMRDQKEARDLATQLSEHTTPISLPKLRAAAGEDLRHRIYQQQPIKNAKITPPPSVTIPIDRVDPKHRRFDEKLGASTDEEKPAKPSRSDSSAPTPKPDDALKTSAASARPRIVLPPRPPSSAPRPAPKSSPGGDADKPKRKTSVTPIQFPPPFRGTQTHKERE